MVKPDRPLIADYGVAGAEYATVERDASEHTHSHLAWFRPCCRPITFASPVTATPPPWSMERGTFLSPGPSPGAAIADNVPGSEKRPASCRDSEMSAKPDTSTDEGNAVAKTNNKPRGRVAIVPERCKGCGYCVAFCPLGVLVMSARFNVKGYHYPEIADETKCSGCDLCGMYCPDFSITGMRLPRK